MLFLGGEGREAHATVVVFLHFHCVLVGLAVKIFPLAMKNWGLGITLVVPAETRTVANTTMVRQTIRLATRRSVIMNCLE